MRLCLKFLGHMFLQSRAYRETLAHAGRPGFIFQNLGVKLGWIRVSKRKLHFLTFRAELSKTRSLLVSGNTSGPGEEHQCLFWPSRSSSGGYDDPSVESGCAVSWSWVPIQQAKKPLDKPLEIQIWFCDMSKLPNFVDFPV